MSVPRDLLVVALLAAATPALPGCAHDFNRRSLGGKASQAELQQVPVRGFKVDVEYFIEREGGDKRDVKGELLAVDQSHVWLLDQTERTWAIARSMIDDLDLDIYSNGAKIGASLWTAGGALSAISHGWYLVFSVPVWLAVGIPTAVASSGTKAMPLVKLDQLYQYARFPAGVPPSWRADRIIGDPPASMGSGGLRAASCQQRCDLLRLRCDAACVAIGPCHASCSDASSACRIACRKRDARPPGPQPTSAPTRQPASRPTIPSDLDEPGHHGASLPRSGP